MMGIIGRMLPLHDRIIPVAAGDPHSYRAQVSTNAQRLDLHGLHGNFVFEVDAEHDPAEGMVFAVRGVESKRLVDVIISSSLAFVENGCHEKGSVKFTPESSESGE